MVTQIFVNLPIKDLNRSVVFFTGLGYQFNPHFTDETATCMIISDTIFVMLLTEQKFAQFTNKAVADASKVTESIICLSAPSRDKVDELVQKAVIAGAMTPIPKQDHGFMYAHGFEDLDGHLWEVVWMDPDAVPKL